MNVARALVVWLGLLLAMVAQGALREALFVPLLGALRAHQLSSVTGALIVILGSAITLRWLGAVGDVARQLRIGALWLALTLVFEVGLGRFVVGRPWAEVLQDFDLSEGRLFTLVLAATLFGPLVAGRFVGREPPP